MQARGRKPKLERQGWPRHGLLRRETGSDLADSLRPKIAKWGYAPEESIGFCPAHANRGICFAWRRRG